MAVEKPIYGRSPNGKPRELQDGLVYRGMWGLDSNDYTEHGVHLNQIIRRLKERRKCDAEEPSKKCNAPRYKEGDK